MAGYLAGVGLRGFHVWCFSCLVVLVCWVVAAAAVFADFSDQYGKPKRAR